MNLPKISLAVVLSVLTLVGCAKPAAQEEHAALLSPYISN